MYQSSQNNQSPIVSTYSRRITGIVVIALVLFVTIRAVTGQSGSVTAQVDSEKLGVLGTYGNAEFILLDEIEEFYLTETMDYGTCVEGEETDNTMSGRYSNDEFGEYTLHIYTDRVPYLVVKYDDQKTIVFNAGNERTTKSIYEDLEEALAP